MSAAIQHAIIPLDAAPAMTQVAAVGYPLRWHR
jgi:hypothetical protein